MGTILMHAFLQDTCNIAFAKQIISVFENNIDELFQFINAENKKGHTALMFISPENRIEFIKEVQRIVSASEENVATTKDDSTRDHDDNDKVSTSETNVKDPPNVDDFNVVANENIVNVLI